MKKIKVNRKSLLDALKKTYWTLGSAKFGDMFYDYHFFACDYLTVLATNGYQALSCYVESEVTPVGEAFEFSIGGYQLRQMLRLLDDEEIEIVCHHSQIEVKHNAGNFLIKTDEIAYDKIRQYSNSSGDVLHTIELEIPDLKRWIDQTSFAMADDELRPALNGVLMEFDGEHLNMVASDGHKLAMVEAGSVAVDFKQDVIIPKATIVLMKRTLPKVGWCRLQIYDRSIDLTVLDADRKEVMLLHSNIIDGRFPNWRSVVPEYADMEMTVERKKLLTAARRANVFANNSEVIKIRLVENSDKATVEAQDKDFEYSSSECLTLVKPFFCNKIAFVENFTFAFKGSSLIEILKHLSGEEITISTRGETYGCVFNQSSIGNDAVSYLLMPMLCCD